LPDAFRILQRPSDSDFVSAIIPQISEEAMLFPDPLELGAEQVPTWQAGAPERVSTLFEGQDGVPFSTRRFYAESGGEVGDTSLSLWRGGRARAVGT
jgi:alanyl-tRNA synthetase